MATRISHWLLLGLSSITVPWTTLFLSVVLYIVVPVIAAQLWRRVLLSLGGDRALSATLRQLQPVSLVALLATVVLSFGFRGEQIFAATAGNPAIGCADRRPGVHECRD